MIYNSICELNMGKRVLLFNLIIIGLLSLLLNFSCSMPQQNIDKENKEESLIINNVFDNFTK